MRDLPRQSELIDGALIFAAPQTRWHSHTVSLLTAELRRQAPEDLDAIHGMTVRLDERQAPATDVVVVTAEAMRRERPDHYFFPEDVRLVVEAVLPDSAIRDRDVKPRRYAAAGIKHFWRVEQDDGRTIVYVYQLDPATGSYVPTGIHHDRLKLTLPFGIDIDIDLTSTGTLRRPPGPA
ncbi:Uma2 family endonuclease [Actinomadura montaniterrae]|uniref:Uma2 family endonuclease n=2 Tax=Actinomadura montaniterrae TaxID=1803903 RepID=A0A6L3VW06_9ACTN|nr:Uma2 family endonuclease [Actinomadura montaniterrae]